MRSATILVSLTIAASALWWWPLVIDPNLHFPWYLPLAFTAVWTCLATALSHGRWLRFVVASAIGAFGGLCTGLTIWPLTDGIARTYIPSVVGAVTLATVFVSLVAGLVGRKLKVSSESWRRALWIASAGCAAFGLVALGLTPPLVARRLARNDQTASERFTSLKRAVEQTMSEAGGPERICDGQQLKRHYFGPPISDSEWGYITGNYVTRDGYSFMVYCREKNGYTIVANPFGEKGDGTRQFCTDESRKVSCGMQWTRTRNACVPCTE